MTQKGTVNSCFFFVQDFLETATASKFNRLESYLFTSCSKVQQLSDGQLTKKFYGRNPFLRRIPLFSESFTGKRFWNCKRSKKSASFCGIIFRTWKDQQNFLEIFVFRLLVKFSRFSWFLVCEGQWRSQYRNGIERFSLHFSLNRVIPSQKF